MPLSSVACIMLSSKELLGGDTLGGDTLVGFEKLGFNGIAVYHSEKWESVVLTQQLILLASVCMSTQGVRVTIKEC